MSFHKLCPCAKQADNTHCTEANAWRSVAPTLYSPPDKNERCRRHTSKRSHSKQLALLFAKGLSQPGNLTVHINVVGFATTLGRSSIVRIPRCWAVVVLALASTLASTLAPVIVSTAFSERVSPAATALLGLPAPVMLRLFAPTLQDKRMPHSKTRNNHTQQQSRTLSVVLLRGTLLPLGATCPLGRT